MLDRSAGARPSLTICTSSAMPGAAMPRRLMTPSPCSSTAGTSAPTMPAGRCIAPAADVPKWNTGGGSLLTSIAAVTPCAAATPVASTGAAGPAYANAAVSATAFRVASMAICTSCSAFCRRYASMAARRCSRSISRIWLRLAASLCASLAKKSSCAMRSLSVMSARLAS